MIVELSILTGKWQNTGGSQMTADDVEKTSLRRNTTSEYFLDRKKSKNNALAIYSSLVTSWSLYGLTFKCLSAYLFITKGLVLFFNMVNPTGGLLVEISDRTRE